MATKAFLAVTAVTALVLGAVIAERTEAMLRQEEFLAIVSHDLRNPLNVIGMASKSLLNLRPGEAGDGGGAQAAALLERSLDRVHALIRDFLDSSAIEAGRLNLESRAARTRPCPRCRSRAIRSRRATWASARCRR